MILKIERREFKAGSTEEYEAYSNTWAKGCWVIGEIEMIHHKHIPKKDIEKYLEYGSFYDLAIKHLTREKRISNRALNIQIKFSDPSKGPYHIFLQDCTCYLCNNDGKTIDKITS